MNKPKIIDIDQCIDDRGFLYQIYNLDLSEKIKRVYLVGNFSKKTIRGMHYHEREWKYFFVPKGTVKLIVSPENKPSDKTFSFILTDKKPSLLIVPPKHYNGWIALEDKTILMGMSNFTLKESLTDDKRSDPLAFKEYFRVKDR